MANKQPKKTTNSKGKKPAFNFYWIYAIIAVILISINLFNWDGGVREITPQKFRTEMLEKDQVAKLEIVNKEIVRIYIKQESLSNDTHKTLDEKSLFGGSNRGPHYFFTILNDEKLKDDITIWEINME